MSDTFVLPATALKQLGYVAEQLGKLQAALPEYLWLDTTINILAWEQAELNEKVAVGVMQYNDFDEYDYVPFASPRRKATP